METLTIQNRRWFRPFDNSDNPNCWQVDLVADDVRAVLSEAGLEPDESSDDWGHAFSWTNSSGVVHALTITCADVATAEYTISYFAFRRSSLVFTRHVANSASDFGIIAPRIQQLSD